MSDQYNNRRPWISRVPFVSTSVKPAILEREHGGMTPEHAAGWYDTITFGWLKSIIAVGYTRPLEKSDLYQLSPSRDSAKYARLMEQAFEKRRLRAQEINDHIDKGDLEAPLRLRFWWGLTGDASQKRQKWISSHPRAEPSLVLALNDAVFWWLWVGGLFKVVADISTVTVPLLIRAITNFASESYAKHGQPDAPSLGKGIGLAIGMFLLQAFSVIFNVHGFYRGFTTGLILRSALIHSLFSRSLRLTNRARTQGGLTTGKLVAMISTDVSRIDFCMGFFHLAWTSPVQMLICLALLIYNLGYSALPGFALCVLMTPVQGRITKVLFLLRKRSMVWTDKRIKTLQEVLGGMRIIKYFGWEVPYMKRVAEYRNKEMSFLRSRLIVRSFNNAIAFSLPVLSSVVSIVTYASTGHKLDAGIIFSSLSLFTLLRIPLQFLPVSLNAIADAQSAIERIKEVLLAEVNDETWTIDRELPVAIRIRNGSFTWEEPLRGPVVKDASPARLRALQRVSRAWKKAVKKISNFSKKSTFEQVESSASSAIEKSGIRMISTPPQEKKRVDREVFKLADVNLEIPRGQLCAIVGPIGSGKSSLIQSIIGEMRKTSGDVLVGGDIAYCAQSAWIQSATIRENILFGSSYDEDKYNRVVSDCCLLPDFKMLNHGDLTEVGEKGVSLSGGQKQRINIARAVYHGGDTVLLDDSFSALDVHVAENVFENVLQKALDGKTRVLVTHSLQILPKVDVIITMVDGFIQEQGTYAELISKGGPFSTFIAEFTSEHEQQKEGPAEEAKSEEQPVELKSDTNQSKAPIPPALDEERFRGGVNWRTYKDYLFTAHVAVIFPLFVVAVAVYQGSSIMSPYWLVLWQQNSFKLSSGVYMAVYAVLGLGQAFGLFFMGSVFAIVTFYSSSTLHRNALNRIINAPISFYDTTPLGRIMNRLSKDVDTIDNVIGDAIRMFVGTVAQVIGAIVLVSIIQPYFLIAVAVIVLAYYWVGIFYRPSAREIRRLDALLRSSLYAHFSESLNGASTVRAYGEYSRFRGENANRINIENRAYWLSIATQRWLSIRLDLLGSFLLLAVGLLAVGARYSISPAQTGVIVSYTFTVQQAFGWMIRHSAEIENNMNAVERLLYYAEHIEQEDKSSDNLPPSEWPTRGEIELKDIELSHRPGLPLALKGLSVKIRPGEHVGVVGRTGAGKSSLVSALFRMAELSSGSIEIDGLDTKKMPLNALRRKLAVIPQDPLLFSGTIRTNLDPFQTHDDATLNRALKDACLVEKLDVDGEPYHGGDITLDAVVEEEGLNLSLGQRCLVGLARALVSDSRIVILDEATASVDYSTERAIQNTLRDSFSEKTVLCIAHRLRTILAYDRICVLDNGTLAEFDTPLNLFAKADGVFRGMCERSGIDQKDIEEATLDRI